MNALTTNTTERPAQGCGISERSADEIGRCIVCSISTCAECRDASNRCAACAQWAADLFSTLDRFNEADEAIRFWIYRRNEAGKRALELLRIHPRFTTLRFSAKHIGWRSGAILKRTIARAVKRGHIEDPSLKASA